MDNAMVLYAGIALLGVLVSAVSQVILKKSANKKHESAVKEYLNPAVIFAYSLFVVSTLMGTLAFKVIPLSMGPILDATGYIYVTAFGILIFHEKMNKQKIVALVLILVGIGIYSLGI